MDRDVGAEATARVSVIVPCTRPNLIEGIARALAAQAGGVGCELLVAGDVSDLDATGWGIPTRLIPCPDLHPNRRRGLGPERSVAPVIAFIDDDAIPEPGWLDAAAGMGPGAMEIWTGPETPTRRSPGAVLAHSVASSLFAEGTRAHVDPLDHVVRWTDVYSFQILQWFHYLVPAGQ